MVHKITKAQNIQFQLMKNASFNEFNGDNVVALLKDNKDLWDSVVMQRTGCYEDKLTMDLIHLRDMETGFTNVDTVFIKATKGQEQKLYNLAKTSFKADEVDWLPSDEVSRRMGGPADSKVLRVWWD